MAAGRCFGGRSEGDDLDRHGRDFDAIVVGAGIAGLATAERLAAAGLRVLVVEGQPEAGGLLRSVEVGDARIEAYYHHVFPQDHEFRALIDRLGLRSRLEWRRARTVVVAGCRLHYFDTPADVLRFGPLPPQARLRLAFGSAAFTTLGSRRYDGWRIGEAGPKVFGHAGFEALWKPLLDGKFGDSSADVAAAWLRARMRQRMQARRLHGDRLGYMEGGFGTFVSAYVEAISRAATVDLGSAVERAEPLRDGWRVSTAAGDATSRVVVACIPGPELSRIAALPAEYRARLDAIPYKATACLLLELDRPLGDRYWYNLTDPTPTGCLAAIEHTNWVPAEWYGGRHLVYLAHYADATSPAMTLEPEALLEPVEPALRAINPAYDRAWLQQIRVFRDRWAQPVPVAGGPMPSLSIETGVPGLYHASTAHIYPDDRGVSIGIKLGIRAADAALRWLRQPGGSGRGAARGD